ncbi:hypothetical protein AVEN_274692-1 [Araneus ventricosus]|uniref:Uncharacterized protein n=1 Tax=Araneus ventricosus TaxID=182803 RepID=A0A4Y2UEM4_ARAVE|nr:hypothetical protein AVEN_274692-1 [Araneus ventricosus]
MNQLFLLPIRGRLIDTGTIIDFPLEALISEGTSKIHGKEKLSYQSTRIAPPSFLLLPPFNYHHPTSTQGQAINDDEITIKAGLDLPSNHPGIEHQGGRRG